MMGQSSVGRVFLAVGICLLLMSFGAYQAHAFPCDTEDCETGGCAGQQPSNCPPGICAAPGAACRGCKCVVHPISKDHCNCALK